MRAFSDFGTPMLIGEGYRTFPVLIYTQFISEVGGNSAFAIMAIIIALAIFLIQKHIANRYSFSMNLLHPIEPKKLQKEKWLPFMQQSTELSLSLFYLKST